jgi:hypothetical protein
VATAWSLIRMKYTSQTRLQETTGDDTARRTSLCRGKLVRDHRRRKRFIVSVNGVVLRATRDKVVAGAEADKILLVSVSSERSLAIVLLGIPKPIARVGEEGGTPRPLRMAKVSQSH